MHKGLYTFPNNNIIYNLQFRLNNNIIYNLQFRFRQYSTSHALINITENIRKTLDDQNIGSGIL